jgi:hypothetical protein
MRLLEGHCDHQPSASHPQQPSIRSNAFGEFFVCAPEDLAKVFNWPHRTTPNYYALEATPFYADVSVLPQLGRRTANANTSNPDQLQCHLFRKKRNSQHLVSEIVLSYKLVQCSKFVLLPALVSY